MKVYRSNRLEALAEELLRVMQADREPLARDLRVRELVVVGSQGTERWLSHRIAQEVGVCAGIEFPFLGQLLRRLFGEGLGEPLEGLASWAPDGLTWHVLDVLPDHLAAPAFEPLASYLGAEGARGVIGRRRLQLARRVAETFDRYVTHRPDMVLDWERGGGEAGDWQPILWRALAERIDGRHHAALAELFEKKVEAGELDLSGFPGRLFLFGISSLPPFHVSIFEQLSRRLDVHLFVPTPTPRYWGEMKTEREAERLARRTGKRDEELHVERLPPLLDAFGKLARDFQDVLLERSDSEEPRGDALFRRPEGDDMLQVITRDLLDLRPRGGRHPGAEPPKPFDPATDRSIRVHACHGPTRQVEVLRDELLALFDAEPDLQPRDVVVMTPQLDELAPIVDAVFSDGDRHGHDGAAGFPRIPFQVADRTLRVVNPVAEALLAVLEVARGRFQASSVLDLLALDVVRERYRFGDDDLPLLHRWVAESRIAWGIDDAHREAEGQPVRRENTWRFGLERLLLGLARRGHDRDTFRGVLPYDEMEGSETELLGRFVELCETLFALAREVAVARDLKSWTELLERAVDDLVGDDGDASGYARRVRQELEALRTDGELCGEEELLDFPAVQSLLEGRFETALSRGGFLTGQVTLCSMVPMRSVPFRVVCLLGMDDGAFPRVRTRPSFDKLEERPRRGDRSLRDDDRAIFLEALLSARRHLLITFTGRSPKTNEPLPPAVPVGELLDVLDDAFVTADGRPVRDTILVEHPLQAFSPACFGVIGRDHAAAPASFDRRLARGAARLSAIWAGEANDDAPPLVDGPLAAEPITSESLVELQRFYESPVAWYLKNLSLRLNRRRDEQRDREPIELDRLAAHDIERDLLEWSVDEVAPESPYDAIVASGRLPLGTPSRVFFDQSRDVIEPIAAAVASQLQEPTIEPVDIDLRLDRGSLVGRVDGLRATGLLQWQAGKIKPKQRLGLWIRHLALCASEAVDAPRSVLVGRGAVGPVETMALPPVEPEAARRHLDDLLHWLELGRREPLMFFPETSRMYAVTLAEAKLLARDREGAPASDEDRLANDRKACDAAAGVWRAGGHKGSKEYGEGTEVWVTRVLGSPPLSPWEPDFAIPGLGEPTAPGFRELALAIWQPLIDLGAAGGAR